MKKAFAFLVIAFLFCSSTYAQEKNADTLVYKVFSTIKNNDASSYVQNFVNYKQFRSLLIESVENTKDSSEKVVSMQTALRFSENDYNEQLIKPLEKSFRKFMDRLALKGIDPSGLIFVSAEYEEQNARGFEHQKLFRGNIFVTTNNQDYKIPFVCTWLETQKGWFGMSLRDILKKGEKEVWPAGDTVITDTVVVQKIEWMVPPSPPPPPPPKKKTVIKSPQRKAKVKS